MDNKDLKKVVESALDKQKVPHVKLKKIGTSKVDVASLTEPSKRDLNARIIGVRG